MKNPTRICEVCTRLQTVIKRGERVKEDIKLDLTLSDETSYRKKKKSECNNLRKGKRKHKKKKENISSDKM